MSSVEEVLDCLQIPLNDLSKATNGFSNGNIIGSGEFGTVYKGVSGKHGNIAVKMLYPQYDQQEEEFRTEISLLSVYKHENIVPLLGFCFEYGQRLLVYEYESNGSLDKYLSSTELNWIQRLQICLDAARGLQYLHDGTGSHQRILHRDIKSSNILLNENWTAKISDFGLYKFNTGMMSSFLFSNFANGNTEYVDPAYAETGLLTKESDVYSFGIVLFEVLCGSLARVRESTDQHQFSASLIKKHWERKTLDEIILPDLKKQINQASLLTFATISYQCLMSRRERPTMEKVVEQLEKALDKQLATSGLRRNDEACAAHDHQGQSGLSQTSSSSSPSWKYDVFISFRGEDTRKTFVDHLFWTLRDRKILTYKDDELLPRGELIGPSLLKAIEESRIAIIVFSQNYANSSWCLDELAFIMKNRDERGQTVIPIFYDVEPSEPRKQTRYYGEALARHELENRNKVESWREALVKAGNLSGWDLRTVANGHEAKAIRKICDDISQKLLN